MDEQATFSHEDMHPVSSACDRLLRSSCPVRQLFQRRVGTLLFAERSKPQAFSLRARSSVLYPSLVHFLSFA